MVYLTHKTVDRFKKNDAYESYKQGALWML